MFWHTQAIILNLLKLSGEIIHSYIDTAKYRWNTFCVTVLRKEASLHKQIILNIANIFHDLFSVFTSIM